MTFSKIFLKIPFTARIYLFLDAWAILCGLFGIFLILSRISYEPPEVTKVLIFTAFVCFSISSFLAPGEYGLFSFLGIKGRKEAQILNKNIIGNHISSSISDEVLKQIFYSLLKRPIGGMISSLRYAGGDVLIIMFVFYLAGAKMENLLIVFAGGAISTFLLLIFSNFFVEKSISFVLKECRMMLKKRGLIVVESDKNSLKGKFNYFVLLFILMFIILLTFVSHITLNIAGIVLIGLIMIIIISRFLFLSIYDVFTEVRYFAKKLPKGEKTFYTSGDLTKESMELSKSLNQSAEELYNSKMRIMRQQKELTEAYNEIKNKKENLEKFYKLTVGRELKMAELKKKIKNLEQDKE